MLLMFDDFKSNKVKRMTTVRHQVAVTEKERGCNEIWVKGGGRRRIAFLKAVQILFVTFFAI